MTDQAEDAIASFVELEGKKVSGEKLRELLKGYRVDVDRSYLDIGCALSAATEAKLWKAWGHDSWENYVSDELGMKPRRAFYYMKIGKFFTTEVPVPREPLIRIGVSKAALLAGHVTKKNWKAKFAEAEKLSWRALAEKLAESAQVEGEDSSKQKKLSETGSGATTVEDLTKLNFHVYDDQADVIEQALAVVEKRCAAEGNPSDKRGYLLTQMCVEFLSSYPDSMEPILRQIIKVAEKTYGCEVVVNRG